jgi:hypothetical protein
MSSLYEINEQLLNLTDSETGEITDWSAFEALQLARDEKIENIALYHKNLLAEAAALKAEEKSFAERRKRAENKAESLKKYLATSLNGSKFNTTRVSISYRKSTSVDVLDVEKLPEAYRKTVTTVSADKTAIGAALKAGELVDGATLVRKNNLSIK